MIDKKAFRTLTYGLFVIGSKMPDGRMAGCIANTFQQVASDPVRVLVSLNKLNATTAAVQGSGRFTASVLSQEATMDLIGTFGFRSSIDTEKFADADHDLDAAQMPRLRQACIASFSVRVVQTVDAGSHLLFIGEVEEACTLDDQPPLTYAYYHEVLRGKTPPKAASYLADDNTPSPKTGKARQAEAVAPRYAWRCTICGHIEYAEELPDDFTCPICGVGKELFERIEL